MIVRTLTLRNIYEVHVDKAVRKFRTLGRYDDELTRWEKFTDNPPISEITDSTIADFKAAWLGCDFSAETIETTLNTLFMIMRVAQKHGLLATLPSRGIRQHSQPRRTAKVPFDEFNLFVAAITDPLPFKRPAKWFRAFWGTAYFTGLRLADLLDLESRQISKAGIEVRANKTSKLQRLPMHPVLWRLIEEHGIKSGRLFKICRKRLYASCKNFRLTSGIRRFSPQSARVLAARQFERAHAGAGKILLAHSVAGVTAYYLDAEEILQQASEKLAVPKAFLTDSDRDFAELRETHLVKTFRGLKSLDQEAALRFVEAMRN